jgi:hypothetical protein
MCHFSKDLQRDELWPYSIREHSLNIVSNFALCLLLCKVRNYGRNICIDKITEKLAVA